MNQFTNKVDVITGDSSSRLLTTRELMSSRTNILIRLGLLKEDLDSLLSGQ